MSETPKKYEISHLPYYIGLGLILIGIICFIIGGYTFEDIHTFLANALKNKKYQNIGIVLLLVVGVIHSVLASLKKNIDSYGKKNIIDIYVWLSSTFTVIGTGFLAFTSLKIFCGLLGEIACDIPFLVKNDVFALWPFIVITFIATLYCAIKIGTTVSEIIELAKMLFHDKSDNEPVADTDQEGEIDNETDHEELGNPS